MAKGVGRLDGSKFWDETASLLVMVAHPVRRRIMEETANTWLTFTEIQEKTNIKPQTLSYHLKILGDLLQRRTHGYHISKRGKAARIKIKSAFKTQGSPVTPLIDQLPRDLFTQIRKSMLLWLGLLGLTLIPLSYLFSLSSLAILGNLAIFIWGGSQLGWFFYSMAPTTVTLAVGVKLIHQRRILPLRRVQLNMFLIIVHVGLALLFGVLAPPSAWYYPGALEPLEMWQTGDPLPLGLIWSWIILPFRMMIPLILVVLLIFLLDEPVTRWLIMRKISLFVKTLDLNQEKILQKILQNQ